MNTFYLGDSEFVGIIEGRPYFSENEEDELEFLTNYGDISEINSLITDGMDMLAILLNHADLVSEFNFCKGTALEEVKAYYKDLLKSQADYIIYSEFTKEDE